MYASQSFVSENTYAEYHAALHILIYEAKKANIRITKTILDGFFQDIKALYAIEPSSVEEAALEQIFLELFIT